MNTRVSEIQRRAALQNLIGLQDVDALPEAALVKAGLLSATAAHPAADRIMAAPGGVLQNWALSYAPPIPEGGSVGKALAAGLTSSDFRQDFAATLQVALVEGFRQSQKHRALARMIEVPNFRDVEMAHFSADCSLVPMAEADERVAALVSVDATSARVQSYSRVFNVSRRVIVNDDIGAVGKLLKSVGAHAARLESRMLHELLASNPVLSDGEVMFSFDHDNVASSLGVTAAGLQQAMTLLRNQKTLAGEKADLEVAALVVPAHQELVARQVIREAGLNIDVHGSAWLEGKTWFALASPDVGPTIGMLHLRGGDQPSLIPSKARVEQPGVTVAADHHVGVVALSRIGAVMVIEP